TIAGIVIVTPTWYVGSSKKHLRRRFRPESHLLGANHRPHVNLIKIKLNGNKVGDVVDGVNFFNKCQGRGDRRHVGVCHDSGYWDVTDLNGRFNPSTLISFDFLIFLALILSENKNYYKGNGFNGLFTNQRYYGNHNRFHNGRGNNGYFNVSLKVEEHSNGSSALTTEMNEFLDCTREIKVEDILMIKLKEHVEAEVNNAMFDIDDSKAPGPDGFTTSAGWKEMLKLRDKIRKHVLWKIGDGLSVNVCAGWKEMLKLRDKIRKHVLWKIGDGKSVNVWYNSWNTVGPLCDFVSTMEMYDVGHVLESDSVRYACYPVSSFKEINYKYVTRGGLSCEDEAVTILLINWRPIHLRNLSEMNQRVVVLYTEDDEVHGDLRYGCDVKLLVDACDVLPQILQLLLSLLLSLLLLPLPLPSSFSFSLSLLLDDLFKVFRKFKKEYYHMGAFHGKLSGCLMYKLSDLMRKSTNDLLWLACVALTDQFIHERLLNKRYQEGVMELEEFILRL
nr:cell division control protein 45 homolog [Tanacetum cinerariifolium]